LNDITVLTLVPNAGDRLPRCLKSVQWADDIFCVVDLNTHDGSDEVAKKYTDHVVYHEYVNAAAQRNWALPQIETEWTLVLDADEWVSEELAGRIQKIMAEGGGPDGYDVRRLSYFFGERIHRCGWQRDYNVRLFRTKKGRYVDRWVHSRVEVDGPMGVIHEPMYHDTYRNFEEYFATFHRFTTWSARDMFEAGRKARIRDLTLRPLLRFLDRYILRRGYQDGYRGAVLCGLAAFTVFMKYAKLWDLHRRAAEE
jgi:glycosyltransferase involved in cell wall biosynthesis